MGKCYMVLLLQSLIKSDVVPPYPGRTCVRGAVPWRNVMLHGAPTHSVVQNVLPFSSSSLWCGDILGPLLPTRATTYESGVMGSRRKRQWWTRRPNLRRRESRRRCPTALVCACPVLPCIPVGYVWSLGCVRDVPAASVVVGARSSQPWCGVHPGRAAQGGGDPKLHIQTPFLWLVTPASAVEHCLH